jgi:membrane-associated phospholipid phosphatase
MLLMDRPGAWSRWWVVPLLVAAGFAAMPYDVTVAESLAPTDALPSDLDNLIRLSEVYAHGIGASVLLVTIWVLDRRQRRELLRVGVASLGAGLAANLGKLFVSRIRPYHFDRAGDGWATFADWLPGLGGVSHFQSFPSAHAATAIGLAIGLSWLYPQGRWLFYLFAVLAASQRIVSRNHYLSDTLWGMAVGYFVAWGCIYGATVSRGFARLEARTAALPAS